MKHVFVWAVYWQQEEIDEAIAHYQRASQINSEFLDAYIQEGRLLRMKGELEKAVEVYAVAEAISPSSAEVCNGLGLVLVAR